MAGARPVPTTRSSSRRSPTAARARSSPSRRRAAGPGRRVDATDPIGRPVAARWLRSRDGERAVVELAEASGLSRLAAAERDPIGASTRGTGEVLRAVLEAGIRTITLGHRRQRDDRRRRRDPAGPGRRDRGRASSTSQGWTSGSPTSTSGSPATSRTRCSARPAPPPPTGPRRAPRRRQVGELDAALGRYADALEAATGRRRARDARRRRRRRDRVRAALPRRTASAPWPSCPGSRS